MRPGPKFSVVIPTYNRLDFLRQSIDSVRAQTFADYEIIVVDDGSNDGTEDYLRGLVHMHVIRQTNGGPGSARNAGMAAAKGDYIAFLDSDDLWFPWTLGVFARAIDEYASPSMLSGQFLEFTDETQIPQNPQKPYQAVWFSDFLASSRHPLSVGSGTFVLRRAGSESLSFLNDRLNAEDHDLVLRMGTNPGFVQILAPITLAWRRHPFSETGDFWSTVSGTQRLLKHEKCGLYPGGLKRSRERQRILTRHARPVSITCVHEGLVRAGWSLYVAAFTWNVALGRIRYIMGFPLLALSRALRRAAGAQ
jgi:glycosyltransferase involved in cell wall biosynthesis